MISIVVPVFNAEKYLSGMIECLLMQTETDFEVLLIDDGSTDLSGEYCDQISAQDKRFKVIHQDNQGVSSARNLGIDIAAGEWIVFLDADDKIPRNYLEILLNAACGSNADVAVCDVAMFVDDGTCIHRFSLPCGIVSKTAALNMLLSRTLINSGPCGKIINSALAKRFKFPALKTYEDILYIKDIFCNAELIAATDKTEYQYIQNKTGAMSSFTKNPTKDIVVATDELVRFIVSRRDLSDDCLYITLSHLYQYVLSLEETDSILAKEFVLESKRVFRKNRNAVLANHSFSWKEKALYLFFSLV